MRDQTNSSYHERLNRVMIYIQERPDEPITLDRLAQVACLSPFHFHRIFTAHVGETVAEHIRRLRLERAAMKLTATGERVTDVALGAGYETPAAFTKAFRERFGMNPTEFRGRSREISPLLAENKSREEKIVMNPEIRELPETRVLFVRRNGPYAESAASAWGALCGFAYSRRLMSKETRMIGISHDDPEVTSEEKIRYDACITYDGEIRPEGEVGLQNIAAGRYAVFIHNGPYEDLAETYRNIFSGWLPTSGRNLRDNPCFELYLNRDPRRTKPQNLKTEIWVPVA